MTVNSSANSVILTLFAFSDNLSAENSKSSAEFKPQQPQLLECMGGTGKQNKGSSNDAFLAQQSI